MAVGFDIQHPWVFAFGILGNLVSIFVYFAPLPTFRRICREKSTMGFQCVPYVVALFSAMLWMYYALLKTEVLLISINSLGCIIEAIYVLLYIFYASKEARKQAMKLVSILMVGGFCGIMVVTHFGLKDNSVRIKVVGWICVCFSVSVFAAPLSIVLQVVRTGSAEFMPFALSLALTLSAIMWFCYGLLTKDICVAVPNTVGFMLGVLQMLLYGVYRNPKPLRDSTANDPVDLVEQETMPASASASPPEQHVINIVMLGNCDKVQVHPVPAHDSHQPAATPDDDDLVSTMSSDDDDLVEKTPPFHNNNNTAGVFGVDEEDGCVPLPPARVNFVPLDSPALLLQCPA